MALPCFLKVNPSESENLLKLCAGVRVCTLGGREGSMAFMKPQEGEGHCPLRCLPFRFSDSYLFVFMNPCTFDYK